MWGGFSVKWYDALIHNQAILNAAWLSKVAAISATVAVALGTLAGMVLTRFGPFKGRTLLWDDGGAAGDAGGDHGLSMLLLFVTMEQVIGWPAGRASPPSSSRTSLSRWPSSR